MNQYHKSSLHSFTFCSMLTSERLLKMKNTLSWVASGGTEISSLPSVPASRVSILVVFAIEGCKQKNALSRGGHNLWVGGGGTPKSNILKFLSHLLPDAFNLIPHSSICMHPNLCPYPDWGNPLPTTTCRQHRTFRSSGQSIDNFRLQQTDFEKKNFLKHLDKRKVGSHIPFNRDFWNSDNYTNMASDPENTFWMAH